MSLSTSWLWDACASGRNRGLPIASAIFPANHISLNIAPEFAEPLHIGFVIGLKELQPECAHKPSACSPPELILHNYSKIFQMARTEHNGVVSLLSKYRTLLS